MEMNHVTQENAASAEELASIMATFVTNVHRTAGRKARQPERVPAIR